MKGSPVIESSNDTLLGKPPTIDVPLLQKALDWATAEWRVALTGGISDWNQEYFFCNTGCCVAGWTAQALGWSPTSTFLSYGDLVGGVVKDGEKDNASAVAREALGLTGREGQTLFDAHNDIYDLWGIAHAVTGGEVEIPEDLQSHVSTELYAGLRRK